MVTKKIRHKNAAGTVYEYDIGAKAENVEQDAGHRFASDEEKENWNGKIGADTQIEFTEAESRQNINTKETLGTILGKVKKFFTDLKPHAFYDLVQNATTAAVDRAVSAAVAKSLQDQINQQNTKIYVEKITATFPGGESGDTGYFAIGNRTIDGKTLIPIAAVPAIPTLNFKAEVVHTHSFCIHLMMYNGTQIKVDVTTDVVVLFVCSE